MKSKNILKFLSDSIKQLKYKSWIITLLIAVCISVFHTACTKDKAESPFDVELCIDNFYSFVIDVQPIVNNSCAYPGCHGMLSPYGDFTTYEGIKESLENGSFQQRVFEVQNMPPGNVPESRRLQTFELEILKCWVNDGYPQN
ncbi:MAG: hypothetical protein EA412_05590 [Chitinophagaceae bacterium]|nr:MAG: hypothetical protein EA412_05590 [Chitinophagaceae bacterium]